MSAKDTAAQGIVKFGDDPVRDWELTYYLRCTAAEAEEIYDAFGVLLCSCRRHDSTDTGDKRCRVPFSGMKPPTLIPDEDSA